MALPLKVCIVATMEGGCMAARATKTTTTEAGRVQVAAEMESSLFGGGVPVLASARRSAAARQSR
eukprot:CAMPEP_0175961614 /NCGR_PEP_ID=MMETSP0108-20121206/36028_1 /TAXON_ID=195067 ORGANISM="Goniomonas pacifica, Strain CCMP1869" /NCGR_SAMPLE_ID=MMETSP0108 /ASSEMBLY_ACC=CAM_ASM_000204 /LENGTH=64 /DNA_ID=CAMNT_0017289353 /DNA_START=17 /DNA_END=209 /DNA_ORIENTATION=+